MIFWSREVPPASGTSGACAADDSAPSARRRAKIRKKKRELLNLTNKDEDEPNYVPVTTGMPTWKVSWFRLTSLVRRSVCTVVDWPGILNPPGLYRAVVWAGMEAPVIPASQSL